jgi:DNA repair protein RadC
MTRETSNSPAQALCHVREAEDALIAQAALILERRLADKTSGEKLTDPAVAGRMFCLKLSDRTHETFMAAFLDTHHRVIAVEELFHGNSTGCEVHPSEVAKRALLLNATAVIVAHNHPSGNNEPSAADRAVTARLKQALALLDVRLLDHFVCAGPNAVSLAARGWL